MKKFFCIVLMLILILIPINSYAVTINSPNAILIDADSGRILYENNAYEKAYPASTTKILTAILTLENCDLTDEVKASYNAIMSVPSGSSIANIQVDEVLTVRDLLNALLICSGNDAANVLAEHIGGSIESFATMMNTRAKELGAKNTHFINANGLHDEDHYSCAYDLAIFAKYAMDNFPVFREIVSTIRFRLPATNKYDTDDRYFLNSNQLIVPNESKSAKNYYYQYSTGIKTGFTTPAKNCLVSSATKNNVSLICVILGALQDDSGVSYRYTETKDLFEYGFSQLESTTIIEENQFIDKFEITGAPKKDNVVRAVAEEGLTISLNKEDVLNDFTPDITLKEDLAAPIEKGDVLGTATYHIYDKDYTINLIAGNAVEKKSEIIIIIIKTIGIILGTLIILIILILIIRAYNKAKRKKRNSYRTRRYNRRFR